MYWILLAVTPEPEPSTPSDPVQDSIIGVFLQYGIIGALLLVVGWYARSLIQREQARADRLEAEVNRLNTLVQEKTIPALVTATQAIQQSQSLLQAIQNQREIDEQISRRRRSRDDEV